MEVRQEALPSDSGLGQVQSSGQVSLLNVPDLPVHHLQLLFESLHILPRVLLFLLGGVALHLATGESEPQRTGGLLGHVLGLGHRDHEGGARVALETLLHQHGECTVPVGDEAPRPPETELMDAPAQRTQTDVDVLGLLRPQVDHLAPVDPLAARQVHEHELVAHLHVVTLGHPLDHHHTVGPAGPVIQGVTLGSPGGLYQLHHGYHVAATLYLAVGLALGLELRLYAIHREGPVRPLLEGGLPLPVRPVLGLASLHQVPPRFHLIGGAEPRNRDLYLVIQEVETVVEVYLHHRDGYLGVATLALHYHVQCAGTHAPLVRGIVEELRRPEERVGLATARLSIDEEGGVDSPQELQHQGGHHLLVGLLLTPLGTDYLAEGA